LLDFRSVLLELLDISPRVSGLALQDVYAFGAQEILKLTTGIP